MSILGILVAGILSIILWFEVASNGDMSTGERAAFIVAGLVETLLFVASCLGFVGAVVRKQLFVQIYTYFIYFHFLLNIGVASYLLYVIVRFSGNAKIKLCQDTIQNAQTQGQCTGLLNIAQGVYYAVAAIVLLVELCMDQYFMACQHLTHLFHADLAIVVTRYLNQLQSEKRSARSLRKENEEAFSLVSKGKGRYSALPDRFPVYSNSGPDFDPYAEIQDHVRTESRSIRQEQLQNPEEEGYGGGFWTHSDISSEEKARLKLVYNETDEPEHISNPPTYALSE
ncbi:hypothetical protein H0H92_014443 [Tricholoma furcatifolium]|nr:hypothetical protein H0H92_014443 [Tricholoma furcatifolium]